MIAHLKGILLQKSPQSVLVDVRGVGYEVSVPLSTFYHIPEEGGEISLHVHTHVREDTLQLFGFHTTAEKALFMMLISVSGIGPKLALNILSGIGPQDLLNAMAAGDAPRLQAIPGVGRKTSERIALELKDRAVKALKDIQAPKAATRPPTEGDLTEDGISALINLGYSAKAARQAVERATAALVKPGLEALIKEALRLLS